ncbi:MAG: transporter [Akkermansiaceae bacterium]
MKKIFYHFVAVNTLSLFAFTTPLLAGVSEDLPFCHLPDEHSTHDHHKGSPAPIGVMGSHLHEKGSLMASYRWMTMSMEQSFDGDSRISDSQARGSSMMTPTDMQMDMHMLSVMYAPSNKLTLMLMTSYQENSMSMVNAMGATSRMETSGWGDISLAGYYGIYQAQDSSAHVGLGISAPTGSIDETLPNGLNMGFPMQLGSGTWDLNPSITWLSHSGSWSYGAQASALLRLGRNDNGYALGNRATITSWVSREINDWSALSLRFTATDWGNVDGSDTNMPPTMMSSVFGTDNRGGSRVDLALGYSVWASEHGTRFGIELGAPVYQKLDGPQLGIDWTLTAGIQFSW